MIQEQHDGHTQEELLAHRMTADAKEGVHRYRKELSCYIAIIRQISI